MESFPVRFGKYILIDLIAVGGMAEVFRAKLAVESTASDRVFALKRILPMHTGNEDFVRLFEKEIGLAMGLSHPNLVKIYDFGAVKSQNFLAMEYVHGISLKTLMDHVAANRGRFPIDFSCRLAMPLSQALAYLHGLKDHISGKYVGITHRDVSPQNVMLSYSGEVKLFDFGVAKAIVNENTATGSFKGKPAYMSPEQVTGEEIDARTDIFSLGIVLWELLAGRSLFSTGQAITTIQNVMEAPIPAPSSINAGVHPALDAIVLKCLERDCGRRYQAAQLLADDLDTFLSTHYPQSAAPTMSAFLRSTLGAQIDRENELLATRMQNPAPLVANSIELEGGGNPQPEWLRSGPTKHPFEIANGSRARAETPVFPERSRQSSRFVTISLLLVFLGIAGAWYRFSGQANVRTAPTENVQESVAAGTMQLNAVREPSGAGQPALPSAALEFQPAVDYKSQECRKGRPVCALGNEKIEDFSSACAAADAHARVLYEGMCDGDLNPVVQFKNVSLMGGWRKTKESRRTSTYGDQLEIAVKTRNMPDFLHLEVFFVLANSSQMWKAKNMDTLDTAVSLSKTLPNGTYDLELRAVDANGRVVLVKRLNKPFQIEDGAAAAPHFIEL